MIGLFPQHNVLWVHLYCCIFLNFLLFKAQITFPCVCIPHFICSSPDGLLGCFHIVAAVNSDCCDLGGIITDTSSRSWFPFFQIYTQKWDAGSYGTAIFNRLRNLYAVFHSNSTILHSCEHYTRVPVYPYPHQHVFFGLFDNSHPNMYKVCDFNLSFPDTYWSWTICSYSC